MARNSSKVQRNVAQHKTPADTESTKQYTHKFVNVYLSKSDTDWLTEHDPDAYQHVGDFMDKVSSGYELSIREDSKSGKWNSMLKCSDVESSNNGLILSVRARTFFDALYALAYSVMVKLPGDWEDSSITGDSRFN